VTAPEAGRVAHENVAGGYYVQIGQNLMALVPLAFLMRKPPPNAAPAHGH
jgi:multidrug resistance efflux pump